MLDVVIRNEIAIIELKLAEIGNVNDMSFVSDASGAHSAAGKVEETAADI